MALTNQNWVVLALFAAATAYSLHQRYTSTAARIRRTLRRTPRSDVASAREQEMVKVVGVIDFMGEPLKAPISGRPCAGYEVTVHLEGRNGGQRLVRDVAHTDFWLNDGTGTALVRMKDAQVRIHRDAHRRSGTFKNATPELDAFLHKHGMSSVDVAFGVSFNKALRYEEGVLEKGERVAVAGYATREADIREGKAPGDSRYDHSRRLVLQWRSEAMPLYVSDEPDVLR